MNNDQPPPVENPGMDPTNASLAAQNRKILQGLARLENLVADESPTPIEIANQIDDALRADAELETPKFSDFCRFYLSQLVTEIRCPIGYAPPESVGPDPEKRERFRAEKCSRCGHTELKEISFLNSRFLACGHCDLLQLTAEQKKVFCEYLKKDSVLLDKFETIPLRTDAGFAKAQAQAKMVGSLLALVEAMGTDEPISEVPEGWAPVMLAINPATGDFLTIAGPRSGPDGRVEPVETMVGRLMSNAVFEAVGAVREAGKPQPKPRDEGRPQPKPWDEARPQAKPGEPDYVEESEE